MLISYLMDFCFESDFCDFILLAAGRSNVSAKMPSISVYLQEFFQFLGTQLHLARVSITTLQTICTNLRFLIFLASVLLDSSFPLSTLQQKFLCLFGLYLVPCYSKIPRFVRLVVYADFQSLPQGLSTNTSRNQNF